MRRLALSLLLLASCSNNSSSQAQLVRSSERLSEVELDAEQLKRTLFEVRKEHEASAAKLEAYTSTLDTLQKGCAEARAIEEMAQSAQTKAEESMKRGEEVSQLRAQITDTLRLVEQTQKKVQMLESHLQGYWGKIDTLLALKNELAALKSDIHSPFKKTSAIYTVEPGDSLEFIARKFGFEPSVLADLNNLSEGGLKTGQKLHLPAHPSE